MNNFEPSKYLSIIKSLGDANSPISISVLKEKTNLKESTLFRGLNWLQNIQTKDSLKKLEVFYLKPNVYVQSLGQNRSKNNTYKLNKTGLDIYNSLFVKEAEIAFVDEIIRDYKIYEKLWDFIYQNEEVFLHRNSINNIELEQWTLQLFEFFEHKEEETIDQLLEYIPGPKNLRLFRFLELISSIILTHPLWRKQINVSSITKKQFQYLEDIPLFKEEFYVFGTFPDVFCIYKSDNLIQTLFRLVEKYLKISYWKEISVTTPISTINKRILEGVLEEMYKICRKYRKFISDYVLDFKALIKSTITAKIADTNSQLRFPLNLMSSHNKERFNFNLNKKLLQSDIENLPSKLFDIGASHEIVIGQAKRLKIQSEKEPDNLKIKLQLLEMLVHNYTHELRNDFEFYRNLHVGLKDLIDQLLDELLLSESTSQRTVLTLGFIFYKNKFRDFTKALKFSKELYEYYQDDEYFLENLLILHYTQKEWELEIIENLTYNSLKKFPDNINFLLSNLVIKAIQDKNFIKSNKFQKEIKGIVELEDLILNFIAIIKFFIKQIKNQDLKYLSLEFLEQMNKFVRNPDIQLIYAEELMSQGFITQAIEEYIYLIDVFPNYFIESNLLTQLSFRRNLNRIDKSNEVIDFLFKIIKILNQLSTSMEWHIGKSNFKDYKKNKEIFLSKLKNNLKGLEPLLINNFTLSLPLKIKAIMLKSLNRKKNLESCLKKILDISPNNIWANTELALLYFEKDLFNEAIDLLQKVDHLKDLEHYSIPYLNLSWFSNILEINKYNLFRIYKEAKRYHEAILLMEDFIVNPPPSRNYFPNETELAELLIYCYWEEFGNIDVIYERILILSSKIDKPRKDDQLFASSTNTESAFLKQGFIDFVFKQQNYTKCLEWLHQFNKEDPRFLEPQHSYFSPFNKNIYYLAECNLNLNNLIFAKKYFLHSQEDLRNDIRFEAKMQLFLIRVFPDYLKIDEKAFYEKQINKGLIKIENLLNKLDNLSNLIFKTNIKRSLGNISLLLKERGSQSYIFQELQNYILSHPPEIRSYYKIIISIACAINGYIDEMYKYISQKDLMEKYPINHKILHLLYSYYTEGFEQFNNKNVELTKLIPYSLLPLLFNLHYLRFKIGKDRDQNIFNIFKSIWNVNKTQLTLVGEEKKIFEFLKSNLTWYPFRWALNYEDYVKIQSKEDVALLLSVFDCINNKVPSGIDELYVFVTRFINQDRNIRKMLNYLMMVKSYSFPDTKYHLLKELNLGIDDYGMELYGEIAYKVNMLQDVIKDIDEYRKKMVNKRRISTHKIHWADERYFKILLYAFKNKEFDETKIPEFYKIIKRMGEISTEKVKYYAALMNLRERNYKGAEINSYQILVIFKENLELDWNDDYFKIWVISKILESFNKNLKPDPMYFLEEINNVFDFEKMNKTVLHFQLLILDIIDHELLEDFRNEMIEFETQVAIEIIKLIDLSDNKDLELIAEKLTRKREIIHKFDEKIVEFIDKIIFNLIPSSRRAVLYKNYLYYLKALILFENQKVSEARIIIEDLFRSIGENEFFSIYYDINDLLLEMK